MGQRLGTMMARVGRTTNHSDALPEWVPEAARLYLDHTECGQPIRALARETGSHASTVLRKVRKTESRRDDPLVDAVLTDLGRLRRAKGSGCNACDEVTPRMTQHRIDDAKLKRDATRILRALMQPGALMAVMPDVATAVVVCENSDGVPRQIATTPREVAEVMALREWIRCKVQGRVSRYYITPAGRVALNRFLAESETARAGFAEAPSGFDHAAAGGLFGATGKAPRRRSAGTESPLQVLARRRDKDGAPYLGADLVEVGERLRLDFELALIGQSTGFNWDSLSMPPGGGARQSGGGNERQLAAKERLARAMRKLGPELGEVALMTCCQQQGMEAAESRMKMPARSGKYVLRIALNMLARHYRQNRDDDHDLIY